MTSRNVEAAGPSSLPRSGAETSVSVKILHPESDRDVWEKIQSMRLREGAKVTVVLAAGSNTELNADETVRVATAIKRYPTNPDVKVVVRVDEDDVTRNPARMREVENVRAACEAAGIGFGTIEQEASNSRVEAENSANPPDEQRETIGEPTHLVQVVQAEALGRRVANGARRGLRRIPSGGRAPESVTILSQATLPRGARRTEKPGEIAALLADALQDLGVPVQLIRRGAQRLKSLLSTRTRE